METQIAGSIARMDGSTSQDAIFKDVLAYKEVLAHIMKTCVPEYKDCTIPQIIGYIEPNPQVGQVGLHPDETNPPKIQGMSTESTTTTEERVVYDVRFSAVAPGEDGKIGLIINIEAQSKYHPGYPLVKRAIYYCGRMLSAQYGSVFTQSHYGEIQKVYSIWICTRPPKERENTITSYTLQERHLVGHVTEPVRNYDLMNVTMICLGKPEGKHYGGLLRMLEVLFTGRYAAKEVIQILEDGRNDGGQEGMEALLDYVSDIIGYRPDGYMLITLDAFVDVVNLMGGVEFDVPMDMFYEDPSQDLYIDLKEGKQKLDGYEAMGLVRFRKGYADQDLGRVDVQRQFLSACMDQWLTLPNLVKLPQILSTVQASSESDLTTGNLLWIAYTAWRSGLGNLQTVTLPGYADMIDGVSYYILDPAGVADVINQSCNPYTREIDANDLNIVY